MGYGDYTPSGGGHQKPLTKAQIRKAKEAYAKADTINAELRKREQEEQEQMNQKIEDELKMI